VTLDARDIYLGRYGTKQSRAEYDRLVAEWLACGRRLPVSGNLTMSDLVLAYWKYAKDYHRWGRHDGYNLKDALRIVRELYGSTPAATFGPLALKACRQKMIERDWSRNYVNAQTARISRMFKWAASEQMLPGHLYVDLKTVEGLRKGKTIAREGRRIRPVAHEHVEAAIPFMPPTVQAMVRFELLTGCRPAEVCLIRPIDIEMRNPACWVYGPQRHKTEQHNIDRFILIGPKAQQVLRPYLGVKLDAYCFNPAASEAKRNGQRRQKRRSPMTPSQARRRPKRNRRRAPRQRYDTGSYRQAIQRACQKANENAIAEARRIDPALPANTVLVPQWAPNQLRHARATELRRYGLDVTKTILGHTKVETSEVYAEKDVAAAVELVSKIG
jgi:integrase